MTDAQIERNLDFQKAMLILEQNGDNTTPEYLFGLWRMVGSNMARYPDIERYSPWYAGLENLIK